jgi:hypothetical protein
MRAPDLVRYALWLAVLATAHANRRRYHMPTTWLPHLALNSGALLLPELCSLIRRAGYGAPFPETRRMIEGTLGALVEPRDAYVVHIAPFTAGYLLSHPDFDIYKGDLGRVRLAGFGLDAIPHSATATGLCLLIADAVQDAARLAPGGPLRVLLARAAARPMAAAGATLAILTAVWETGEMLAYRYELRVKGDPSLINMQWSPLDTARDCAANAAGWLVAWLVHRAETLPG